MDSVKSYFRLNPECRLVEGACRGALYNLLDGNVFSLTPELCEVLKRCESNIRLDEILNIHILPDSEALGFLDHLVDLGYGTFFNHPHYIEKCTTERIVRFKPFYRDPPRLELVFLEIGNQCNLDCFFCKLDRTALRRRGCVSCRREAAEDSRVFDGNRLEEALVQVKDLGCAAMAIHGGNPFCRPGDLIQTICMATRLGFKSITIGTNGIGAPKELISILKRSEIMLVIQAFSHREKIHDRIVNRPGSFNKLKESLKHYQQEGIRFAINILTTGFSEPKLHDTEIFFKRFGPEQISFDYLLDVVFNKDISTVSEKEKALGLGLSTDYSYYHQRQDISTTRLEQFVHNQRYNSCLKGKLAITRNGDVLPCPLMRRESVGNLHHTSLLDIFSSGNLDAYWQLSKDKINGCKYCEFRFACSDCRGLVSTAGAGLDGMKYCAYDPQHGHWL